MSLDIETETLQVSKSTIPKCKDVWDIVYSSAPVIAGYLLETFVILISFGFMNDTIEIAALGLGTMWLNALSTSLLFALSAGFEALVAQAHGAEDYKLCNAYYQKAWSVFGIIFLFVLVVILFAEHLLIMTGIEPNLAHETYVFMLCASLSSYFTGMIWLLCAFLGAQNIFEIGFVGAIAAIVSHFLACVVFTNLIESRLIAIGVATSVSFGLDFLVIYIYMLKKFAHLKTLGRFDPKIAFSGLFTFFKQAFVPGVVIYLEWLAYEMFTLQASGLKSEAAVAVHVVCSNLITTYYQFGEGLGMILTSFIGNSMGAGDKFSAKRYFYAGFITMCGLNIVCNVLVTAFEDGLIEFFFADEEPMELMEELVTLLQIFIWFDGLQVILSGTLRGIGKASATSYIYVITLLGVGQIAAYVFAYTYDLNLFGIWWGIIFGWVVLDSCLGVVLVKTDWDQQVLQIKQEIEMANDLQPEKDEDSAYQEIA